MIHIIIGTKAQLIKMAPVIKELKSRSLHYNFINLGQHANTINSLIDQFNLSPPDFCFSTKNDIATIFEIIKWFFSMVLLVVFRKNYLKEVVFKGKGGLVLIHGDTLSTLIGLIMAKRAGLKVAHVESGLRSWNFFHPFPEELIRVICMKFSDYLFAPTDKAVDNLHKKGVMGKVFNTEGNTGLDASRIVAQGSKLKIKSSMPKPYVLVSIHRFENIYSKKRFSFILNRLEKISDDLNIVWVMHGPTEKMLRKFGVRTSNSDLDSRITYLPLQEYAIFLQLLKDAEFVITDGGSVQEECSYLGKPCLIMRKKTERSAGLGENALLGRFDKVIMENFIHEYKKFSKGKMRPEVSPSNILIDQIEALL